jgi:hypothetical protein
MGFRTTLSRPAAAALALVSALPAAGCRPSAPPVATLIGWARIPADTFVTGPTSGQFITATNGRVPPFPHAQPVEGFSALLTAGDGEFLALADNGFGTQETSADFLLRVYQLRPDFRTRRGGSATVEVKPAFLLRDPQRHIPFRIVADRARYPDSDIPVDPSIRAGRMLTGADFDVESFRRAADGTFWFGDEFGPFLLHTDTDGVLLEPPIPLPGVRSPQHPDLGAGTPNLPQSGGFEGMALTAGGRALLPVLEHPRRDAGPELDVYRFDLTTSRYSQQEPNEPAYRYRMESEATSVTEFVLWRDDTYLVIERDDAEGPNARVKRIFRVDLRDAVPGGVLSKSLVVDLLNVADPDDLGGLGMGRFTLPYFTTEAIAVIDDSTIAVINDNNYPFGAGRSGAGGPDETEFVLIRIREP